MNDNNKTAVLNFAVCTLLCIVIFTNECYSAPVLSGMEIVAGSRGTILSLTADTRFQCSLQQNNQSEIRIFLPGCVYGLEEFSFLKFEKNAPVSSVIAQEKNDGSGIELIISLKIIPEQSIITKDKGNQQLFLLSKLATADYSWNAIAVFGEKPVVSRLQPNVNRPEIDQLAAPVHAPSTVQSIRKTDSITSVRDRISDSSTNVARLQNVSMLQRGLVCKLVFEFDREVSGGIRRRENSLDIIFSGAKNTLNKKMFDIEPGTVFQKVFLNEKGAHKDTLQCTVEIEASASGLPYNITHQDNRVLSVYILQKTEQRAAFWTAVSGLQWQHEFTHVPYKELDLEKMGKRAEYDVTVEFPTESVFRTGEFVSKPSERQTAVKNTHSDSLPNLNNSIRAEQSEKMTDKPPISAVLETVEKKIDLSITENENVSADTVIFTANICNIRALPSIQSSVIGKGISGTEAKRVAISNDWTQVSVNGTVGWVNNRLIKNKEVLQPQIAQTANIVTSDVRGKLYTKEEKRIGTGDSLAIQKVSHLLVTGTDSIKKEPIDKIIRYTARGRDPFFALVKDSRILDGKPVVENLALVGLLVDGKDKIALFEDKAHQRRPFTLKENDAVEQGRVLKIYRDRVVFLLTELGISRSYTVKLTNTESEQEVRAQ